MTCDVRATGLKSLSSLGRPFLGTGTRHDVFHSVGTLPKRRLRLKMCCRGALSSTVPDFSSLGHILSGPAAFLVWSLLISPLNWSAVKVCRRGEVWASVVLQLTKLSPPEVLDDSAIVGLITNEEDSEYRELIQGCVDWCLQNHLQINAGKTKELVVDFRRCRHPLPLVNIRGMDIERVDSYKYLGVHLNNKLDWSVNTTALHKGQSRLYLLRRLRSCGVQGALLRTFFHTVVASALFYGVVCWGSSISTADRKRLDQLLKRAGSVLGSPLDPVQVVGDRRTLAKLASMLENDSHPMHETLAALGSSFSNRLLHPKCVKERYRRGQFQNAGTGASLGGQDSKQPEKLALDQNGESEQKLDEE
ncbi:hypothetical protein NFI96_006516 [Prochilodus magdalenae]|nr:hypothetical protein NFI96_006516 [Prochilodus magdalenae]